MTITIVVRKPIPAQNGGNVTESQLEQNLLSGFGEIMDCVGDEVSHQIDLAYKELAESYESALKYINKAKYDNRYAFIIKQGDSYSVLAPLELTSKEENMYCPYNDDSMRRIFHLDKNSSLVMYLVSKDKIIRKEIGEYRKIKQNENVVRGHVLDAMRIEQCLEKLNLLNKKDDEKDDDGGTRDFEKELEDTLNSMNL